MLEGISKYSDCKVLLKKFKFVLSQFNECSIHYFRLFERETPFFSTSIRHLCYLRIIVELRIPNYPYK